MDTCHFVWEAGTQFISSTAEELRPTDTRSTSARIHCKTLLMRASFYPCWNLNDRAQTFSPESCMLQLECFHQFSALPWLQSCFWIWFAISAIWIENGVSQFPLLRTFLARNTQKQAQKLSPFPVAPATCAERREEKKLKEGGKKGIFFFFFWSLNVLIMLVKFCDRKEDLKSKSILFEVVYTSQALRCLKLLS